MHRLKAILDGILIALFVEGIILVPVVIIVASLGDTLRTLKYLVPDIVAIVPYVVVKLTKREVKTTRLNFAGILLATIAGVCFLVFFTGLTLVSCAGHPPY